MPNTNNIIAQTYYEQALHATALDELSLEPLDVDENDSAVLNQKAS